MTTLVLVRRLHLYLGLLLLPWFVMFGASSFVLNHPTWFEGVGPNASRVAWTPLAERGYDLEVPADADLRAVAARIITDLGMSVDAGFGVYRPNARRLNVNLPRFRHPIRITYFIDEHRVLAEKRPALPAPILTGLHTRGGYYLQAPRQTAWAVTVDLLCVVLLFWIASGLYMWWQLPSTRTWGWVALGAGLASFAFVMLTL